MMEDRLQTFGVPWDPLLPRQLEAFAHRLWRVSRCHLSSFPYLVGYWCNIFPNYRNIGSRRVGSRRLRLTRLLSLSEPNQSSWFWPWQQRRWRNRIWMLKKQLQPQVQKSKCCNMSLTSHGSVQGVRSQQILLLLQVRRYGALTRRWSIWPRFEEFRRVACCQQDCWYLIES